MRTKQTYLATISISSMLGLALLSGCHNGEEVSSRGQDFTPPGAPTAMSRISNAQAAKGAVADAMLYEQNFDGTTLNSLGRNKLDLILRGTRADENITIYLSMSQDSGKNRQGAVTDYLKDAGVNENAIQIVLGPNPHSTTPAAFNLPDVYKGDTGTFNGVSADSTSGAGAPAAK